jgi:sodium/potassium-transporting ATPase subunit alpha
MTILAIKTSRLVEWTFSRQIANTECIPKLCFAQLFFGTALIVVIVISGLSFYYQEFKSAKIMESFNRIMSPRFTMVKREGHFKEVFVDELVAGDIVKLTYGEIIPADIRLFECHEFFVDNSSLTGESDPKKRAPICTHNDPMLSKNLVFYSTHAVEGHATGLVVAVGGSTLMGKIVEVAGNIVAKKAKSPVVAEIEDFIKIISIRSLIVGVAFTLVALVLRCSWKNCISFFTEIVVASIPEGLNLTCTMLLVMMAKKMASKHCLVKNLHALEILGSSSVMITDKTGTLTQNRMSIGKVITLFTTVLADQFSQPVVMAKCQWLK